MMNEITENIQTYYDLSYPLAEKMRMIDDLADQLGELLDWVLSVDFQVVQKPAQNTDNPEYLPDGEDHSQNEMNNKIQTSLYAVTIIAGDIDDDDAPVFFATACADEALIRLQTYIDLMEKLEIRNLAYSEAHYASVLKKLEDYYNQDCEDVLEEIALISFFEFNTRLNMAD
ncbi:hypothetical protein [Facilibium subflavum]|uniref:hypothetical protein n=1 Tax=Facilibium subflavum TaxID=2219058 RepID=UPI000E64B192|nr:hypothetical protein [Facilibium subflavum]